MTCFTVILKPTAVKQLKQLPAKAAAKVALKLDLLSEDAAPIGAKKLSGHEDLWRLRFGGYRIVYEGPDAKHVIRVLKIAPRGGVYKQL